MPLKFEVDIQSQNKVRVRKQKNPIWPARQPFWKWHRWKSIGFCLWPPSTCIWNLKLKFQSKLDLCSGNHVVYRQTDGRTDGRTRWSQYTPPPHPPPPNSNFVGQGYKNHIETYLLLFHCHLDSKYHSDVIIWVPWRRRPPANRLFVQHRVRQTPKKTPQLNITGHLWEFFTGGRSLAKGQYITVTS